MTANATADPMVEAVHSAASAIVGIMPIMIAVATVLGLLMMFISVALGPHSGDAPRMLPSLAEAFWNGHLNAFGWTIYWDGDARW